MDKAQAQAMALQKMANHGLIEKGWRFAFNKRKSALGLCNYSKKTIYLSEIYVSLNNVGNVLNTILHEIAHAIAGHKAGHGVQWQAVCLRIGCRPERCNSQPDLTMPDKKYRLAYRRPDGSLELLDCTRDRRGDMTGRQMRGRPETKNNLIWVENKA